MVLLLSIQIQSIASMIGRNVDDLIHDKRRTLYKVFAWNDHKASPASRLSACTRLLYPPATMISPAITPVDSIEPNLRLPKAFRLFADPECIKFHLLRRQYIKLHQ